MPINISLMSSPRSLERISEINGLFQGGMLTKVSESSLIGISDDGTKLTVSDDLNQEIIEQSGNLIKELRSIDIVSLKLKDANISQEKSITVGELKNALSLVEQMPCAAEKAGLKKLTTFEKVKGSLLRSMGIEPDKVKNAHRYFMGLGLSCGRCPESNVKKSYNDKHQWIGQGLPMAIVAYSKKRDMIALHLPNGKVLEFDADHPQQIDAVVQNYVKNYQSNTASTEDKAQAKITTDEAEDVNTASSVDSIDGRQFNIGNACIKLRFADITKSHGDATVNPGNPSMDRGGGACGAINRAAGWSFLEKYIKDNDIKCSEGEAVILPGGNLPVENIVYTVGPKNQDYTGRPAELFNACVKTYISVFRSMMEIGHSLNKKCIAVNLLPISAGLYTVPIEVSVKAMIAAINAVFDENHNFKFDIKLHFNPDGKNKESEKMRTSATLLANAETKDSTPSEKIEQETAITVDNLSRKTEVSNWPPYVDRINFNAFKRTCKNSGWDPIYLESIESLMGKLEKYAYDSDLLESTREIFFYQSQSTGMIAYTKPIIKKFKITEMKEFKVTEIAFITPEEMEQRDIKNYIPDYQAFFSGKE